MAAVGASSEGRGSERRPLPASTWLGVGVVGLLLFGLGIWTPAWHGVASGVWLGYAAAVAGGIVACVGFSFAYSAREATRRPRLEELPGVEVYRPDGGLRGPPGR